MVVGQLFKAFKDRYRTILQNSYNNVAIISSPFQLLNLNELIIDKKLKQIFVIVIYRSSFELAKIDAVSNFTKLKINKLVKSRFLISHIKILILAIRLKNFENLIISSLFDNRMLLLSNLVNNKKTFLIDDGTESILALKTYKDRDANCDDNFSKLLSFFKLSIKYPKKILFYSSFNTSNENKPSYNFIKSKLNLLNVNDDIFFIGQPLFEMTGDDFYNKTLEVFSNMNVKYFPHRLESKENLNIIEKYYGFEIIKSDLIFECYLATIDYLPYKIISFYSTVLFTSSFLLKQRNINDVKIEYIPLPERISQRIPNVNLVYSYLENHKYISKFKPY